MTLTKNKTDQGVSRGTNYEHHKVNDDEERMNAGGEDAEGGVLETPRFGWSCIIASIVHSR